MKILWIDPITSGDEADLESTSEFLKPFLFDGTDVVIRKVNRGTESIESRLDEVYSTIPMLDIALQGELDGFDACIIGCAGDAGVAEAKDVLKIPVVGPGEASLLTARLIGKRIVILTTLQARIPSLEDKIEHFIPQGRFFIYATNIPVVEFRKDIQSTIETLSGIINRSVEQDRADTAILACLGMRGMADELQKRVHIPVIDPAVAAIEFAQIMVKMKLSQAKGAYPSPPPKMRSL